MLENPREAVTNHARYASESLSPGVTATEYDADGRPPPLDSEGYRITVDDGRESFFALCLEDPDREDAWLMSDTVHALDNVR